MNLLQGKVALITGASSGIGRAAALLFSAEGANVVLNARGDAALEDVAARIRSQGGEVRIVAGDASQPGTHERLIAEAQAAFGGLDIAFNNAGATGPIGPLADISFADWQATIAVNLHAAFLGSVHQIPAMLARGGAQSSSPQVSSAPTSVCPAWPPMARPKRVMGLVKGIAADYGDQGIRANALMPGGVDTAMAGNAEQKEWAAGLHAMKRIARPEEIASAALFLASPMASFVTGSAMFADGGNSAVK